MKSSTEILRILMLHNRYQYTGGEDASTEADIQILHQARHQVTLVEEHNTRIEKFSYQEKLQLLFASAWNPKTYQLLRSQIQTLEPDLLHVQNFFPLFSPSVHAAAKSLDVPTVQHLHNFRLGCLNSYFFREGKVCEACLGRNPWRGLVYRCYRDSLPASLGVWNMITFNRYRKTWLKDVDAFITPSQFAANKLIEIGIPGDRLYVKPNVTPDPLADTPIPSLPSQPTFLFIGRLSPEKGVSLLLKAWEILAEDEWQLNIIGDGPQRPTLEQYASDRQLTNVYFQGYQPVNKVFEAIQQSTAIIVPSQWYETFGRVVIEAFACGRSVIVSSLGALAELVEEGKTGLLVPHDDINAWAERLRWGGNHLLEMAHMGQQCRQAYLQKYTSAVNYQQTMNIYRRILS